ncbi:YT521-B-like domain-containing protein [Mycena capillaripes]|nr:YT521-B-like domain-containing protein [Mycena capillaripes]
MTSESNMTLGLQNDHLPRDDGKFQPRIIPPILSRSQAESVGLTLFSHPGDRVGNRPNAPVSHALPFPALVFTHDCTTRDSTLELTSDGLNDLAESVYVTDSDQYMAFPYRSANNQHHLGREQYAAGPSTDPFYPPKHPDANQSHNLVSYPDPSTPLSSGATSHMQSKRRSYHPKPPAQRSEWVMWVGNIPSEAVHDELWRFFTRPLDEGGSASTNGVLSIFLISRSCCAFVNYATQAHLDAAIAHFNGVPLRADPRCLLLVCRPRRKDDDLRAGVGGQRGMGMHARWVKAQAEKASSVPSDSATTSLSALTVSIDSNTDVPTWPPRRQPSNSSASQASTSSSILREHFPQRFFILKALTQTDLDLSVQTGVWATQKHNEGVLDRAFRTSKDVFLIFSVNKSGEFYGYARMAGSVGQGDDTAPLLSADHLVADSPAPMTTPSTAPMRSAPAELGVAHHRLSAPDAALKGKGVSLDAELAVRTSAALVLDETAPFRAARAGADAPRKGEADHEHGQDFELQWLCTDRLPFQRTRHLRNPWNHDHEIKVSRDGTELEPSVGSVLLEEWGVYLNLNNEAEAAKVGTRQKVKAGRGRGKGPGL